MARAADAGDCVKIGAKFPKNLEIARLRIKSPKMTSTNSKPKVF